ncbi:MAG: SigE family RNA polymerase sigma factor [Actinomycetota bacterium]|nr:SigE family RNA polymerase sigma factor [Actinomycetota bacterium]
MTVLIGMGRTLMRRFARGQEPSVPAGFAEFFAASHPSLLRTAWLLTGDSEAAQDLVQAALVKAFVAWPRIREGEALAYTRRILVNENIDRWRRARHEARPAEDPLARVPPATAVVDDRDQIIRMLEQLPEQQRKVVVLRYYADLSESATATALGISLGAVKSASSRGVAKLRSIHQIQGALDGSD